MDEIVQSVKQVTDIMADIVAASIKQSSGIVQVNQAVTQIDEVTQQNAALVVQAELLAETIAQIRLNTDSHPVKLSSKSMLVVMHKRAPH
jgi:methyl-accepting chemotaxis protein